MLCPARVGQLSQPAMRSTAHAVIWDLAYYCIPEQLLVDVSPVATKFARYLETCKVPVSLCPQSCGHVLDD